MRRDKLKWWQVAVMLFVGCLVLLVAYYVNNYLHPEASLPVRVKPIPWEWLGDFIATFVSVVLLAFLIAELNDAFWLTKGGSLRYRLKKAFTTVFLKFKCSSYAFMYRLYSSKVDNYQASGGKTRSEHYQHIAELVRKRGYYYDKYWECKNKQ